LLADFVYFSHVHLQASYFRFQTSYIRFQAGCVRFYFCYIGLNDEVFAE